MTTEKKERLSAKDALTENQSAAEAIRQKRAAEAEAERLRKIENDRWLRSEGLQRELDRIDEKIAEKTKEGKDRKLVVALDYKNDNGTIVAELALADLESRGYRVDMKSDWIPAYRGSCDDGYAYAHDAYLETYLTIQW